MMTRGFLSFALAAVFLLSLFSSAVLLQKAEPDYSYERFRAFEVREIAVKRAFYAAVSEAARGALAASSSSGAGAYPAVKAAAHGRAMEFSQKLSQQGYDAAFWCGEPTHEERRQASLSMQRQKRAVAPEGTLPLESCAGAIDADLLLRRLHFSALGFSLYSGGLGIGRAAGFPSDFEADF